MTSENTISRTASGALVMSPFEHVRSQLARQKWAVDSRNENALWNIYAENATLIIKSEGVTEIARVAGRGEIIGFMTRGWYANPNPSSGSMIHHVGTIMLEPAEDGMIRCWSYATYVHLESGKTELHGYGKYHDLWTFEADLWRMHEREVHVFGLNMGQSPAAS